MRWLPAVSSGKTSYEKDERGVKMLKKFAAIALVAGLVTVFGGCHAEGGADNHKGNVNVGGGSK
jgi:hypothetical protein